MNQIVSRTRSDNRRQLVLEAAADLFVLKGYRGTSMRDIAKSTNMLPGSLYYHFPSKAALLIAVIEEGVQRIGDCVDIALQNEVSECANGNPWQRLQIACEAHLAMLIGGSSFAQVVVRLLPGDAPEVEASLIALRDNYEARFRELVEDLPLSPKTDRGIFRLMLMGAMNHAPVWFRRGGATPSMLACQFVGNLRASQECLNGDDATSITDCSKENI